MSAPRPGTDVSTDVSTDVVVTGLGAVTPLGGDVASTWSALLAGESGARVLDDEWAGELPVRLAAPAAADPAEVLGRVEARTLDRGQQLALVAALEAWADAGAPEVDPERLAVVVGTGIGGIMTTLSAYDTLRERGARRVSPHAVPMLMPNGPAATVGLRLGARAGVHAPVSACASGAEAIALALDILRSGRADVVVCGGTEAAVHPLPLAASPRCGRCRPVTTSPRPPRARSTRAATASSSARAPGCSCSRPRRTRPHAAGRRTPSWPAPA